MQPLIYNNDHLPIPPDSNPRIEWSEVTPHLLSNPGKWMLLIPAAPNSRTAHRINAGQISPLRGLGVEAYACRRRPRNDNQNSGWEIWIRKTV